MMSNTEELTSKYHGLYITFLLYFCAVPEALSQPNDNSSRIQTFLWITYFNFASSSIKTYFLVLQTK